ncbi:MAG: hypothetical protein K2X60_04530 [Xanthobacteraceae bacterium]|nr:hypothetical protein [Xanthobacteraceae bacterium]
MPYALFTNNEQISKAYDSEREVWKKADEAGLVVDVASEEEASRPRRVLDEDYCIKPCPADTEQTTQAGPTNVHDIKQGSRRTSQRGDKQTGRRTAAAMAIKS